MAEMAKTKVTPQAKHPECTQQFIATVKEALDAFEEQISFPDEEVRSRAYQKLLQAYKEAQRNLCGTWPILQTLILS